MKNTDLGSSQHSAPRAPALTLPATLLENANSQIKHPDLLKQTLWVNESKVRVLTNPVDDANSC